MYPIFLEQIYDQELKFQDHWEVKNFTSYFHNIMLQETLILHTSLDSKQGLVSTLKAGGNKTYKIKLYTLRDANIKN